MESEKKRFCENLREARKKSHLTMRELAKLIHSNHNSVYKWENGNGFPKEDTLHKIAEVLEVDVEWLIGAGMGVKGQPEKWLCEIQNAPADKQEAIKKIWFTIMKL